ncbi:MAG: hypothetical protein ACKOPN_11555, partial [Prochlorococcaceae cyanobacterium]
LWLELAERVHGVMVDPALDEPSRRAADGHQEANAAAAAALGAAVIVGQRHDSAALEQALWRLLGPRLRGAAAVVDPLVELRRGMERLAVRDAERRLADQLVALVG